MLRKASSPLLLVVMVVALAVVIITSWAVGGMGTPAEITVSTATAANSGNADETFYVVGYHWGWAIFSEEGAELDKIRVKRGMTVEIYAVNDHAQEAIDELPAPVAEAIKAIDWKERTIRAVEAGLFPAPEDMTIEEALEIGHEHDENGHVHEGHEHHEDTQTESVWPYMIDHGFLIPWHGAVEYLDTQTQEPARVVFTADRPGEYEFVCVNYCGYGHIYMGQTMLVVE
jgi:hypothetical protein